MHKPFFKQPKWRYGSYSLLFMVLVIAVAVTVNLGLSNLETANGWRKDYSFNNLTTQSETTLKVIEALPYPVHIYALYTKGSEDLALVELLNRYQTRSSLITYEMLELSSNPGLLSKFQGDTENTLSADSLIVSCENTEHYKIISPQNFVNLDYNVESGSYDMVLSYEKQISEALLYVTSDTIPEIMLLEGHNELSGDNTSLLTEMLTGNNYTVRSVNLKAGDTLTKGALLMILSPQIDFAQNELDAIIAFAQAGGSLFITCDFTDPVSEMSNYLSLLRSYGMIPQNGFVVASTEEPQTYYNGTSNAELFLTPYMLDTAPTSSLIEAGMNYLILAGARAFETPDILDNGLTVSPVLKSGYKAYLKKIDSDTLEQTGEEPIGPFSLALLSERLQSDGTASRAFVIGNSTLFTESQFYSITYNLQFLLKMTGYLLNQQPISLDILSKPSVRTVLAPESQTVGTALVVAVPLLILAAALAVLLPRRHR